VIEPDAHPERNFTGIDVVLVVIGLVVAIGWFALIVFATNDLSSEEVKAEDMDFAESAAFLAVTVGPSLFGFWMAYRVLKRVLD
jgi:hypothetical protein